MQPAPLPLTNGEEVSWWQLSCLPRVCASKIDLINAATSQRCRCQATCRNQSTNRSSNPNTAVPCRRCSRLQLSGSATSMVPAELESFTCVLTSATNSRITVRGNIRSPVALERNSKDHRERVFFHPTQVNDRRLKMETRKSINSSPRYAVNQSRESLDWPVQLQMTTLTSWNERSGIQRDSLAQGDHIAAGRKRHNVGRFKTRNKTVTSTVTSTQ